MKPLISLFIVLLCGLESLSEYKDNVRLKRDLLEGYDPNLRPESDNVTTVVSVSLTLHNVEIDEAREVMITYMWGNFEWNDSQLVWDKESYGNVTSIAFAPEEIWHPDIFVYNSADVNFKNQFFQTHKIASNGSILWVPPAKVESYCMLNLKYWPFDSQKCKIKLGSWIYDGFKLDLKLKHDVLDTSDFNSYLGWDLVKSEGRKNTIRYACCSEPYVDITYTLYLKRQSSVLKSLVIFPVIAIVSMVLVSFWLPPQSTKKFVLNGIAIVLTCMMLMHFSRLFPILSSSPPLIVMFYTCTLVMLSFSLIISVIVVNISRNRKRRAVPYTVKSILLDGFIAKAFGVFEPNRKESENHLNDFKQNSLDKIQEDEKIVEREMEQNRNDIQDDWIRLAVFIDRAAFFAYILMFISVILLHFI